MVYLGCMASAVRVLSGQARVAAAPAAAAVAVVLWYCGWALLAPLAVALAALAARPLTAAVRTRGHAAADLAHGSQEPSRPAGAALVSDSSRLCSDYPCRAGMSDPRRSV